MTLGELADKLEELAEAERQVEKWRGAVERAFDPDTIRRREEGLADAKATLALLRAEVIPN